MRNLNEQIGFEMRSQRLLKRMTLAQMADRLGLSSRNTVSTWERGKVQISVTDLKRYCDVLDINYIDILKKASGEM